MPDRTDDTVLIEQSEFLQALYNIRLGKRRLYEDAVVGAFFGVSRVAATQWRHGKADMGVTRFARMREYLLTTYGVDGIVAAAPVFLGEGFRGVVDVASVPTGRDLADEAEDLPGSLGRLHDAIRAARRDGRVDPEEAAEIRQRISEHQQEVADVDAAVRPALRAAS